MRWVVKWLGIGWGVLTAVAACGSNDDDDDGHQYASVVEWRCFERVSAPDACACEGLEPGEELAGSGQVDDCGAYSVCKAYYDGDDWTCQCRQEDFDLNEFTSVHDVASCPPP